VLAAPEKGGLGLSTTTVGGIYGTLGVFALLLGGIVAGIMVSRKGLKYWILPMALAINVPDILYVLLAWTQCTNLWIVGTFVAIEQFGYGIGFAAYMLYLIHFAQGPYKTAHYALATGLMAAGMSLPGMIAGYMSDWLGYTHFFIFVCLCTIPGIIAALIIRKQLPN
jgi:PAT family beta-lactamase induction signal transducer AmpG